jgi:hypothetical protein
MALQTASVSLRAYYEDGRSVTRDHLSKLALNHEAVLEAIADRGPWQSALLVLARRNGEDYEGEADPQERLGEVLRQDLERAAAWLEEQSEGVASLRAAGLEVDVFADLWIDQDQLDWLFPGKFLLACGQAGLPIRMVTND